MLMNRRHFLNGMVAATATTSMQAWAQNLRDSGRGLEITAVEPIAVKVPHSEGTGSGWIFLRLLTNRKDLIGYGEVYTLGIPYSEKISSDIGRMSVLAKRHQSNHPMGR